MEKIPGLIDAQNDGLSSMKWKVLRRADEGSRILVTLTVNFKSVERMEKMSLF